MRIESRIGVESLRVRVEKYISVIFKEITLKKEMAIIVNCVTTTTFAKSILPRNVRNSALFNF
jgi:hypothetical protein